MTQFKRRTGRDDGVPRRRILTGAAVVGAAAVAGAGGYEVAAHVGDGMRRGSGSARQFVSALELQGDRATVGDWPVITYPKAESNSYAIVSLPADAAIVTVDLVWVSDRAGAGSVRWATGLTRIDSDVPFGDDSVSTWQASVARAPTSATVLTTTRMGEYRVAPDSPASKLMVTREGTTSDDTYSAAVHLVGVVLTTAATVPLV